MKKYFVTLAVTVSACTHVALASDNHSYSTSVQQHLYQNRTVHDPVPAGSKGDKVNGRIQTAFQKEFAGASLLKWERVKGSTICLASFIYNNERYNAFFDVDGKLVATSRFIRESNLPLLIKQSMNRKYASYQLLQVIELAQNDETSYLLTFYNGHEKREVQAYNNGSYVTIKKEKKNLVAGL